MTVKQAAKELNKKLIGWSKGHDKLVVGIDGYTGVGKTTLLTSLAAINSNVIPVNRDDFQIPRSKFDKLYANIKQRSKLFELEMNDKEKLENFIQAFKKSHKQLKLKTYDGVTGKVTIPKVYDFSKKIMVVEGVFMFHPKLLNKIWDKRIYLKGDVKQIQKRRIAREKKRWGKDYFPEDHSDSYFRQVIIALDRYEKEYKPKLEADLVLTID